MNTELTNNAETMASKQKKLKGLHHEILIHIHGPTTDAETMVSIALRTKSKEEYKYIIWSLTNDIDERHRDKLVSLFEQARVLYEEI